jgi:hypothetical protein
MNAVTKTALVILTMISPLEVLEGSAILTFDDSPANTVEPVQKRTADSARDFHGRLREGKFEAGRFFFEVKKSIFRAYNFYRESFSILWAKIFFQVCFAFYRANVFFRVCFAFYRANVSFRVCFAFYRANAFFQVCFAFYRANVFYRVSFAFCRENACCLEANLVHRRGHTMTAASLPGTYSSFWAGIF